MDSTAKHVGKLPQTVISACLGKVAYVSAVAAHQALRRMTSRRCWKRGNTGRTLTAYLCPCCQQHHIGSRSRELQTRRKAVTNQTI